MTDYTKIQKALNDYLTSFKLLQDLGVTTNKKDFTSQIGEWFVSELFDGQRATSGVQKDWDLKIGDKFIQVKTHSKAPTTTARWTAIKYDEKANIDELITVIFSADYKLREFYRTPWKEALKIIKRKKNRDVIYWDDQKEFQIKTDDLPKQNLVYGKQNTQRYSSNEIDIFALVCLDTREIGYLKNAETPDTINIRADYLRGTYYDEKGIADYEKVLELSKSIQSQTEIAKKLNLHVAQVNRMLKKDFKPFQTNARYFSDFKRDKEWFITI